MSDIFSARRRRKRQRKKAERPPQTRTPYLYEYRLKKKDAEKA